MAQRSSVARRFNLSQVSAGIVQVLMPLVVVIAFVIPMPPRGLVIRTVRPGIKLLPAGGITPLRIRVLGGTMSNYRAPMRAIQIGAQIIDPAELAAFLTRELPKRPSDWPVYIEGDPDLEYESIARTIDAVSAFGAKVILLTPGFKADLGESPSSAHQAEQRPGTN